MSFWTFMLLLIILGVFMIAQLVKLLNGDSKAGELARSLAWSVIHRIGRHKDKQTASSEEES
jgi:hypothetical protein